MILKVWESVRSNNGIIVLLHLMEVKVPITDADCIRGLACRAMAGLARSDTVRQIISKLPLFTNGLLQSLMRDPILQEKRVEHVQFQKYALELLERVSGKTKTSNQIETSLANIHKANVVAQTKIQFNDQQLNELMYEHLLARGFTESASVLHREANLPTNISANRSTSVYHSPFSFRTPSTPSGRLRIRNKPSDLNATLNALTDTPTTTPTEPAASTSIATNGLANNRMDVDDQTHITPIKLIKKSTTSAQTIVSQQNLAHQQMQQRSLQKQISAIDAAPIFPGPSVRPQPTASNITLETIITEYLTNQHALCKNPMSTCPQFDLILPHKCPDPRPNKMSGLSMNFTARYFRSQAGFSSRRLDRRLIHSNFCVARTIRPEDPDFYITCCAIAPCATSVIVGSYGGEVKVFNINESGEDFSNNYHESFISSIKCSRDGNLIATSCVWRNPLSALWSIENKQFQLKLSWQEEAYMEFANCSNDRILGTKEEAATIYDLTTGQKVSRFVPTILNQYSKNRATFYPTDELILSGLYKGNFLFCFESNRIELKTFIFHFILADGVLWDVRSGREIHKFDKLNQAISGVFHPNGLEVSVQMELIEIEF